MTTDGKLVRAVEWQGVFLFTLSGVSCLLAIGCGDSPLNYTESGAYKARDRVIDLCHRQQKRMSSEELLRLAGTPDLVLRPKRPDKIDDLGRLGYVKGEYSPPYEVWFYVPAIRAGRADWIDWSRRRGTEILLNHLFVLANNEVICYVPNPGLKRMCEEVGIDYEVVLAYIHQRKLARMQHGKGEQSSESAKPNSDELGKTTDATEANPEETR